MYASGVFYGGLCFAYLIESDNKVMELFRMGEELCYPQVRGAADCRLVWQIINR